MRFSNYLTFKMNGRYTGHEVPEILYDTAFAKLSELDPPWGLKNIPQVSMKDYKGSPSVGINYGKVEKGSPVKILYFGYKNRQRTAPPPDCASNDDTLTVEFYPKRVQEDWLYLLDVVFVSYIAATCPYYARLYDDTIHCDDAGQFNEELGEFTPNPDFIEWRHGVYRIWQANYWDSELCRRSFNLTPEEIVDRLSGIVANCRLFQDGVIVICSYEKLVGDGILKLNEMVMPHLVKQDPAVL